MIRALAVLRRRIPRRLGRPCPGRPRQAAGGRRLLHLAVVLARDLPELGDHRPGREQGAVRRALEEAEVSGDRVERRQVAPRLVVPGIVDDKVEEDEQR